MQAGSGVQAFAHHAGCPALPRYALTFTVMDLGGLGNPGLAEGKSLCTNKPCKAPTLLQGSCTDQCPNGGHYHRGKARMGRGLWGRWCGKRAAFPTPPTPFSISDGEKSAGDFWDCCVPTGYLCLPVAQRVGSRQLPPVLSSP